MKLYFHYSLEGFSNSYLIGNEENREAVFVDPGKISPRMLEQLELNNLHLTCVLITHNHESHHRGLETLMRIYEPRIYAADAELNGIPATLLQGNGTFLAAGFAIRYFSTPGHSPDSLMYQIENILFTGDSLTAGRLGRTNNVYGTRNLKTHLRKKMLSQDDPIILMPGHGPPSTIGAERLYNTELMHSDDDYHKPQEEWF